MALKLRRVYREGSLMKDEDKDLLVQVVAFCASLILIVILVISLSYAEAYIWLTMYKKIILRQ
jgi:hypothetical protein